MSAQILMPADEVLANDYWGHDQNSPAQKATVSATDFSAYRNYHAIQCSLVYSKLEYSVIKGYEELRAIIELLRSDESRTSILSTLRRTDKQPAPDSTYESSLNLAARLLCMLKVGRGENQVASRGCLEWQGGSLRNFIAQQFSEPPVLETSHIRFTKAFNAWSLNVIGGLAIEFTDNIADHLLLVSDDTKVLIFHHVAFLDSQENSQLFPEGFIDETNRTLALLFPQNDFGTPRRKDSYKKIWFKKLISNSFPCVIDPQLGHGNGTLRAEQRQPEHFHFWRDRLVILKQTFDEATPTTLAQWWYDRRNGERWYTFWVAILVLVVTAFLGFVQCIESALQVYKAFYPA